MKKIFFLVLIVAAIVITGLYLVNKDHLGKKGNSNQPTISIQSSPTLLGTSTTASPLTEYQVPILMYHYIRDYNNPQDKIGTNLSVSPQKFEEQLQWLKDNDYQTVNIGDLVGSGEGSFDFAQDKNHKYVIFTFDDGYQDTYTAAYPLLKKYNFMATFYIITNYIDQGNPQYLSWDEIREMKKANMNFGSHTLIHPDLTKINLDRVNRELIDSKKILEEKLASNISDFCYPSGKYNQKTITALKNAGYKTATTVKNGIANQGSNLLELPRIRMQNDTNLEKVLE